MTLKKAAVIITITALFILSLPGMQKESSMKENPNRLQVPLALREAYTKGTRSPDGKPGPRYWQNRADYRIRGELEPDTGLVKGRETITYRNHSPHNLDRLVLHLYQDLYKKGAVRNKPVDPADLHDGVEITRFKIGGREAGPQGRAKEVLRQGTVMMVKLAAPLAAGETIELEIHWHFTMPRKSDIRIGSYGGGTHFIGYWFPRMAVYDDIDGWDELNYMGLQEFYHDVDDYDVEITVPRGYIVWGTGMLTNPGEVLAEKYLKRYKRALAADELIHIAAAADLKENRVTADNPKNRWRFRAENVTDFAFAASRRFLWDASSILVMDGNRRVLVSAAYKEGEKEFYEAVDLAKKSIRFYSKECPAAAYPYPAFTVFNGGDQMEFPMMSNYASSPNRELSVYSVTHELAHTYFPFYVATNERKYAWMDEGWAEFLPIPLQHRLESTSTPEEWTASQYALLARESMALPPMTPSILFLDEDLYTAANYWRPCTAFRFLREMLGDQRFLNGLQAFIMRWKGKHPLPYDLFNTFNDVVKEDLSWFWKPWFFDAGVPDLAIRKVSVHRDECTVTVAQNSNVPLPVLLTFVYSDGSSESTAETAAVWKEGKKRFSITRKIGKPLREIRLGNKVIPDSNEKNNVYIIDRKRD